MTEVKTEEIKSKVMKFAEPDDRKAWISLGYSLCIELVAILLIRTNLLIMGWGLHTLNEIRLFVQFHDMAHLSFFNSMTLNKVLGNVLGIYNHFPFAAWRDGHNHHHKHFGNLDRLDLSQTILFTKSQYNQMSPLKRFAIRLFR
jgi:omega-6 fatty acid desaturase (delta-12 desaturase)